MTSHSRTAAVLASGRFRRFVAAVLIGIAVGFVIFVATSHGLRSTNGGRVGGDFPAFYGAGTLVATGQANALYDRAAQRRVQSGLLPDHPGGWIDFAYPPAVALAYVPFALVPFKVAYVMHSLVMAALCLLAVYLVRPVSTLVRDHQLPAVAATLAFYPIFRAVVGGQNTAASLLCATGVLAAVARGDDLRAGVWTGAWLFKPQLALVAAVLVGLRRGWRFWLGVAVVGALYYAVGTAMHGPGWPMWWWHDGVRPFLKADIEIDRGNGISVREVASDLGMPWLGLALAATIGLVATWLALSRSTSRILVVGIACTAASLVSPHALFYDGGLALIAVLGSAEAGREHVAPVLVLAWLLPLLQPFRQVLLIPPITVGLLLVFGVTVWTAVTEREHAVPDAR